VHPLTPLSIDYLIQSFINGSSNSQLAAKAKFFEGKFDQDSFFISVISKLKQGIWFQTNPSNDLISYSDGLFTINFGCNFLTGKACFNIPLRFKPKHKSGYQFFEVSPLSIFHLISNMSFS
jgi:hypothetical protein